MAAKPGDTRIVAEWLEKWEPREDGEFYVDDQVYMTAVCPNMEVAERLARERDIWREGSVLIEEYQHKDFGIYDWFPVEEFFVCDLASSEEAQP